MGNWAVFFIGLACFVVGIAVGWNGKGWKDGSTTTAGEAAGQAQTALDSGIEADRKIVASTTETETAVERVRVVERTVTVDAGCEPGAGPVSPVWDDRLRDLAKARQTRAANADLGARRVPE